MIDNEHDLKALIDEALQRERVALDTEFFWERTFYPILATVQIGFSESECYLIDAVALPNLPGFGELLSSSSTEKILHDAQQDLAILCRACGGDSPRNIFDTRRAAGFAGGDSTLSLANLLKAELGIDLPKTETRSDWLQRPLSEAQIEYALNDVRHLPQLRDILVSKAEKLGNLDYLLEEMKIYDNPELCLDQEPEGLLHKIKAGRLEARERAILLELIRWREATAKQLNRPRNFILKNRELIEIAKAAPENDRELRRITALPSYAPRRYGPQILDAVKAGINAPLQHPPHTHRLSSRQKEQLAAYITRVHEKARNAGIDPALVGSRKTLTENFMRQQTDRSPDLFDEPSPEPPDGWRNHFL